MNVSERVWAMMEIEGLELRVKPQRAGTGARNWYEARWYTAAIYAYSGHWVWADGEGRTPEEAVADLLEQHGEGIEAHCRKVEGRGYELPEAA